MAHRHNDNLTGEHKATDIGQLTIFCLFMALWISDIIFKYSIFLNAYVPVAIRFPIGIVLLFIAGYMARTGMSIVFGKNAQSQGIIRQGIFRFVRHPIYLSEIILYLGLLVLNISLAATLIWIIAIFFLHYVSRYEEKLLLERFGEEYQKYMNEVPMWFPRLHK